jgi:peptidoglycan/xylan/chitin deacetylase (PgdA/CDA1 family)
MLRKINMPLPLFRKPVYKAFNLIILFSAFLLVGLAIAKVVSFILLIIIPIIWLLFISWGAFYISSGVFISTINNKKTTKNAIALSFDDGPHKNTADILETLRKYNAKASFFVTGEHSEKFENIISQIYNEGHIIGNHTYSHKNTFPFLSSSKMIEEIAKTSIIIKKISGTQPKLFRPPFGITNPQIAKVCKKLGFTVIGWSVRSLDTTIKTPKRIIKRIKKRTKPGSIILLHDYTPHIIIVLEQILKFYSEKGYSFVTINELLTLNN